ncbi:TPA: O144 family O-antigen flippase [Escherichia albertii]
MSSIKKIVLNSSALYIRMIFVMLVNLLATRFLMANFGINGFGLYNVISSIVVLGAFITGILTVSSQRFISSGLATAGHAGANDYLNAIFAVHIICFISIIIILEVFGYIYINGFLKQDVLPINDVYYIYHITVAGFSFSIFISFLNSICIAEENMSAYARFSILDATLKLLIAYSTLFVHKNTMIVYALAMLFEVIIMVFIMVIFIHRRYPYYKIKNNYDFMKIREVFSFVIWSLWGGVATVLSNQGINLLLNYNFGVAINAARGVSMQINSAYLQIVNNFQLAINPQLVKSYASNDISRFERLFFLGSKVSILFSTIIFFILYFNINYVLSLWLINYSEEMVSFSKLIITDAYITSFSTAIILAIQASGRIKIYQSIVGVILLLNLPLSYVALKYWHEPQLVFVVSITLSILSLISRMLFLQKIVKIKFGSFLFAIILPNICVFAIVSLVVNYKISLALTFQQFIINSVVITLLVLFLFVFISLNSMERKVLANNFLKITKGFK